MASRDPLGEITRLFDGALRHALDDYLKVYDIHGGGLRHGVSEWHISYERDGLSRLLIFALEGAANTDLRIRTHVAATDEEGRWAQRDVGSQSIPRPVAQEMLASPHTVAFIVEQARSTAEAISEAELKPLRVGWTMIG